MSYSHGNFHLTISYVFCNLYIVPCTFFCRGGMFIYWLVSSSIGSASNWSAYCIIRAPYLHIFLHIITIEQPPLHLVDNNMDKGRVFRFLFPIVFVAQLISAVVIQGLFVYNKWNYMGSCGIDLISSADRTTLVMLNDRFGMSSQILNTGIII